MAQPFATSTPLNPPQSGQFDTFTIDFAQQQQAHPDKIPATAPAQPKDYYLRLLPWKTMDMTNPANVAGDISINVKITYVKDTSPNPGPLTITSTSVDAGGTFGVISFAATQPVVPLVSVSTFAPSKDAQGNPTFGRLRITSASLPFLGGYEKQGATQVSNLEPKTHYHYIVEAVNEKKEKAYKTGEFTTKTRFVDVFFDKIQMLSGGGPMAFAFFVNGENALGENGQVPAQGLLTIKAGETKSLRIHFPIEDPPAKLEILVNSLIINANSLNLNCTKRILDPNLREHPGKQCEFPLGTKTILLNSLPTGVNEQFTNTFKVTASGGNQTATGAQSLFFDLKYDLTGSFTVKYEAAH
jgi:hypothetical protein